MNGKDFIDLVFIVGIVGVFYLVLVPGRKMLAEARKAREEREAKEVEEGRD